MTDLPGSGARPPVGLAEVLREAADAVAAYDVLDAAIAEGRRRRRWSASVSALGVVAVLALVAAILLPASVREEDAAEPPGVPSIPERIGPPALFTRDAAPNPPGPASVIFSGYRGKLVVVGATADRYRIVAEDAKAGWDALLSPAGDQVAYSSGREIGVVDLEYGGTRAYAPEESTVDEFAPEVWLPDASSLVVLETTYADDPTTQGIRRRLSIMDLDSGALEPFAEATWPIATPGFAVAVSPDGSRIAYQFSDFVTILDRATGAKTRWDLESHDLVLAGRAAWAPDGSLTLLHRVTASNGRAWEFRMVDPATGSERAVRPAMRDQTVVRLIGWSGDDPVVVGYNGTYSAMAGVPGDVISPGFDGTVGVYLLSDHGPRTLLHPVDEISFIDVAEALLADPQTRPGDPPWRLGLPVPPEWLTTIVAVLLVGAWVLASRAQQLRGRRRGLDTPTGRTVRRVNSDRD